MGQHYDACSSTTDTQGSASEDISSSDNLSIQKQTRKAHAKSRAGCFNCKRTRIKCTETRPVCDYCLHRNLHCTWPGMSTQQMVPSIQIAARPVIRAGPRVLPPVFTHEDFRLFTHFIGDGYPHYPLGNDSIWTHEVPSIASRHDFLLHAMLAHSASDIAYNTGDQKLYVSALDHRVKAISSLNREVCNGVQSFEQGNAMVAGCFALLSQTLHIGDGLVEYIIFLRGVVALAVHMGQENLKCIFMNMENDEDLKLMETSLKDAPVLEARIVEAACSCLAGIAVLCTVPVETILHSQMMDMAQNLLTSPRAAYLTLRTCVKELTTMPDAAFKYFIDPTNQVCQLLQAYFVALQMIMIPATTTKSMARRFLDAEKQEKSSERLRSKWVTLLYQHASEEMKVHYTWALRVEEIVFDRAQVSDLIDGTAFSSSSWEKRLTNEPSAVSK